MKIFAKGPNIPAKAGDLMKTGRLRKASSNTIRYYKGEAFKKSVTASKEDQNVTRLRPFCLE